MRTTQVPWWLQGVTLCGYEGEGDGGEGGSGDSGDSGNAGEGGEGEGEGSGEGGDEGSSGEGEKKPEDTAGLKSALEKERLAAKTATKALKAAEKRLAEIDGKDKSEAEKAKEASAKAQEKVTKLATSLKTQALDSAIEREARALKFRDVDDAIRLVDRGAIEVEQDEDDPSDVSVDQKTVKTAVQALANKKKHLIGEEGSEDPSGSKFGGGNKDKKTLTEEALVQKYPALQQ